MDRCSKQGCTSEAQMQHTKTRYKDKIYYTNYCLPCWRTLKMIEGTYKYDKPRPDFWELRQMLLDNRLCPECGKIMFWAAVKGRKGDSASLQHYDDGTIGIMCHSCNTRDGLRKGLLRGFLRKEVNGV